MPDDIVKKPGTASNTGMQQSGTGRRIGLPGLHARVQSVAKTQVTTDPLTLPNRIGIMADTSGSMGCAATADDASGNPTKSRIDCLKDAIQGFLAACDATTTGVAMETFGGYHNEPVSISLSNNFMMVIGMAMGMQAGGCTPMHIAMAAMLAKNPVSRGIIISDGDADSDTAARAEACNFRDAGVPVDTVHIGSGESGEALLREIAELTGGLFIKFKDVSSFAKSFRYLTPGQRHLLLNGNAAALIGADEVRK